MSNEYSQQKLMIYEKFDEGKITADEKNELMAMLESKGEGCKLTQDKIDDFFGQLKKQYPDLEKDVEKLSSKLSKDSDDSGSDDAVDKKESDDEEKEMTEAAKEILSYIDML